MQSESHSTNFTQRYALALTLIALLSSAAFFTLHLALKTSESTALIVNISGKQRMLSQRVASIAQHYYIHLRNGEFSDAKRIKNSLIPVVNEMQEANEKLSSGHLGEDIVVKLSTTIHEFYFGKMNVKKRVDDYIAMANAILINDNSATSDNLVHELTMTSDTLLPDLNIIVTQYQKEGEASIETIKTLELIAWLATLFTLLMEVIFIFQPMATTIAKLFQKDIWHQSSLEKEIQIRTHHLEVANEKLKYSASHDPLTGLNNRLNLERELENLVEHYKKNRIPFAVIMLDIDWFKKVNDNYGHDVGDYVLKELAFLLSDTVRLDDSVYRAGGEEFVIILNRISQSKAMEKTQELRQLIENHLFSMSGNDFHLTISCGVYHPDWIEPIDNHTVMKLADNALYEAKHAGRNRVVSVNLSSCLAFACPLPPPKTVIKIQGEKVLFADFDIIDILGYTSDSLCQEEKTLREIVHQDDYDFFEHFTQTIPFMTTLRVLHANGNYKIIKLECTPQGVGMWKIEIQDPIKLAKSVEGKMVVQNFEAMMRITDDFIYFKDRFHVFTAGSKTLVDITNVSEKENLIGKTDYEVFPQEYADAYFKLEKDVFSGTIEVSRALQPILNNNGNHGWVDNRKYPIKNSEGEIIGLFGIARVVSDLNLLEKEQNV